jgi:hypothetical protein
MQWYVLDLSVLTALKATDYIVQHAVCWRGSDGACSWFADCADDALYNGPALGFVAAAVLLPCSG